MQKQKLVIVSSWNIVFFAIICYSPICNPASFEAGGPLGSHPVRFEMGQPDSQPFKDNGPLWNWLVGWLQSRPACFKQAGWTTSKPANCSLDDFETRQWLRNRLGGQLWSRPAGFETGWVDRLASKWAGWTSLKQADHSLDGFETLQRFQNRLGGQFWNLPTFGPILPTQTISYLKYSTIY